MSNCARTDASSALERVGDRLETAAFELSKLRSRAQLRFRACAGFGRGTAAPHVSPQHQPFRRTYKTTCLCLSLMVQKNNACFHPLPSIKLLIDDRLHSLAYDMSHVDMYGCGLGPIPGSTLTPSSPCSGAPPPSPRYLVLPIVDTATETRYGSGAPSVSDTICDRSERAQGTVSAAHQSRGLPDTTNCGS